MSDMSALGRYLTPADGGADDPRFAGKIRVTDDGRMSIIDVLSCFGFKNPRDAWYKVQKANPELVAISDNWKFPGARQRDTPVTDRKGLTKIIMLLPGKIAARFRDELSVLLERYLEADRSLAEDILRRADGKEGAAIAKLEEHPRIRSSWAAKALNESIKGYMDANQSCGPLYPFVHDTNNLAVTGKKASELKAAFGAPRSASTRNLNSEEQSAALYFLQVCEAKEIQRSGENPLAIATRNRELFEPVCKAKGLHDTLADRECVRDNAKVMRLNQRQNRAAAIAAN